MKPSPFLPMPKAEQRFDLVMSVPTHAAVKRKGGATFVRFLIERELASDPQWIAEMQAAREARAAALAVRRETVLTLRIGRA